MLHVPDVDGEVGYGKHVGMYMYERFLLLDRNHIGIII